MRYTLCDRCPQEVEFATLCNGALFVLAHDCSRKHQCAETVWVKKCSGRAKPLCYGDDQHFDDCTKVIRVRVKEVVYCYDC